MAEAMNVDSGEDVDGRPSWRDFLPPEHYNTPLHALNYTVTRRIGLYLDDQNIEPNMSGTIGDFGGLAELIGFDSLEIQSFERLHQKGKAVLEEWKNRHDLNPTVGRFVEFLIQLEREDILTDLHLLICADVSAFLSRVENFSQREVQPIQDQTVTPGPGHYDEVPKFLAIDEVILGVQILFDAFVCYNMEGNSQMDLYFVKEMASRLEAPPFNLRLFIPGRNDLAGLNAPKITTTIIAERCRHMVVVLSHNFLESESAEFQSHFAFCLSPAARKRRIVPVRLDHCPTPNIMMIMSMCDFTKRDLWDWSWDRLAFSLKQPLSQEDFDVVTPESEGMPETDGSDADSAIGSMQSPHPAHRTAPVTAGSSSAASTSIHREATTPLRPFTTNFSDPRRTSSNPNLSTSGRSFANLMASPRKVPSNPNLDSRKTRSATTSFVQKISNKFSKKSKKSPTATTSF